MTKNKVIWFYDFISVSTSLWLHEYKLLNRLKLQYMSMCSRWLWVYYLLYKWISMEAYDSLILKWFITMIAVWQVFNAWCAHILSLLYNIIKRVCDHIKLPIFNNLSSLVLTENKITPYAVLAACNPVHQI